MNFGSKYVYCYDKSDEESVSDDSDVDIGASRYARLASAGIRHRAGGYSSDSEEEAAAGTPKAAGRSLIQKIKHTVLGVTRRRSSKKMSKADMDAFIRASKNLQTDSYVPAPLQSDSLPPPGPPSPPPGPKKRKKVRKADPNLFTVSVGDYVQPANTHSNNKRLCCVHCSAIMTSFSKFQVKADNKDWTCEFCNRCNPNVDVEDWTKPATDDVTFLLEAAPVDCKEQRLEDTHNVIFVIDISGSMSTTKEADIVDATGRRTRTFVSRLDAVKKAAEFQIKQLLDESPNVRVGLITFGSDVNVYGDGTTPLKKFEHEQIQDSERLKLLSGDLRPLKPISETFDTLTRKLAKLEISGMTALGPGLLTATSLAANVKGSKVVICTDGCANVGIGKLPEGNATEEEVSESRSVYRDFGNYARDKGVSVSVVSLEGTDCRLVHLGLVAQITGGIVDIVDPCNMNDQFGNILTSKTLATDVTVTLCLHHTLYIRDIQSTEQLSTKVEHIGNVSGDSDLVVEFGVKAVANENEQPMTIDEEDGSIQAADGGTEAASGSTDGPKAAGGAAAAGGDAAGDEAASGDAAGDEAAGGEAAGGETTGGEASGGAKTTSGTKAAGGIRSAGTVFNSSTTEGSLNIPPGDEQPPVVNILPGDGQPPAANIPHGDGQPQPDVTVPTDLPFQVQIEFSSRNGAKYLRVVTSLRQCTDKREAAESEINMDIIGAATSNTVSNVALTGNYRLAAGAVKSRKNMTKRVMMQPGATSNDMEEADDYMEDLLDLEGMVQRQQAVTKRSQPRAAGSRSVGMSAPMSAGLNVNCISDELANEYYTRSHHSNAYYARKKMARKGGKS